VSTETTTATHPGTASPGSGFGHGYSAVGEGAMTSGLGSPPGVGAPRRKKTRAAGAAVPIATRPTLLDNVFADLRHHLDALEVYARQRREPRDDDAVADGMDWAIERMRSAVAEIDANHEYLSTEQYAALHGDVTPQSVCNWIRKGELEAIETPNGWRIKRGAVRRQKRSAS
jgi:hypothetical protein